MLARRVMQLGSILIYSTSTPVPGTSGTEIDISAQAAGTIFVPNITANNSLTTLTFWGAPAIVNNQHADLAGLAVTGGYETLYGPDVIYAIAVGAAVVITVAKGKAYPLPPVVFGCGAIIMVGNATGTVDLSFKA